MEQFGPSGLEILAFPCNQARLLVSSEADDWRNSSVPCSLGVKSQDPMQRSKSLLSIVRCDSLSPAQYLAAHVKIDLQNITTDFG